jgi:hypothetical protein
MQNKKRIRLRSRLNFHVKNKIARKRKSTCKRIKQADNAEKIKRFQIRKSNLDLDYKPNVNYFNEYWKMYYENEYILAKIKETVYEINMLKGHLDELKNYENS